MNTKFCLLSFVSSLVLISMNVYAYGYVQTNYPGGNYIEGNQGYTSYSGNPHNHRHHHRNISSQQLIDNQIYQK